MKFKSLLLIVLLLSALMACKKDETTEEPATPAMLGTITTLLQQSVDSLNNMLVATGTAIASSGADTAIVRLGLQQLYAASSFAKEFTFINVQGIMQIVEPSAYHTFEGLDLSDDAAVMGVIQNHSPFFTNYFTATEGYPAVADMHPVNNGATSFGAVEGLFTPYDLLNRIITPRVTPPTEVWVMQLDGTVLFEPDLVGIGLNVFIDPYYTEFPTFVTACHAIQTGESGQTSYTFYLTQTNTPVTKIAWWKTIHIHNNAWKIIWSQQQ